MYVGKCVWMFEQRTGSYGEHESLCVRLFKDNLWIENLSYPTPISRSAFNPNSNVLNNLPTNQVEKIIKK